MISPQTKQRDQRSSNPRPEIWNETRSWTFFVKLFRWFTQLELASTSRAGGATTWVALPLVKIPAWANQLSCFQPPLPQQKLCWVLRACQCFVRLEMCAFHGAVLSTIICNSRTCEIQTGFACPKGVSSTDTTLSSISCSILAVSFQRVVQTLLSSCPGWFAEIDLSCHTTQRAHYCTLWSLCGRGVKPSDSVTTRTLVVDGCWVISIVLRAVTAAVFPCTKSLIT